MADFLRQAHAAPYGAPFDLHIDQQAIPYPPTRLSLGRSAHPLPPRAAATLKWHLSNQIKAITKGKQLMHDSWEYDAHWILPFHQPVPSYSEVVRRVNLANAVKGSCVYCLGLIGCIILAILGRYADVRIRDIARCKGNELLLSLAT